MYQIMKHKFTLLGMHRDVNDYDKQCHECELAKPEIESTDGYRRKRARSRNIKEEINVDLWSSKSKHNKNGFVYEI